MKKIKSLPAFLAAQEQPMEVGWTQLLQQQQQAASLPVEPTGDNVLSPSLAVARSIKPTESIGSIVVGLLINKNTTDDRKIVVLKAALGAPSRVLMFPVGTTDATALANEVLLGTIVRDDATKETSAHTLTPTGGNEADPLVVAIQDALAYPAPAAGEKPKRSVASLFNVLSDALEVAEDAEETGMLAAFVLDQTGDGNVNVYAQAQAGDVSTKVADVQQLEPETTVANPLW